MLDKKPTPKTAIVVGKNVSLYKYLRTDKGEGAGAAGVTTAARLARAGFNVTVFEKNNFTGGRCSLINHKGYVSRCIESC